jgi:pimeloyl-[acyl-carrier protein] methyl ester esterase
MSDAKPLLHVHATGQGSPLVLLHGWALHAGLFAPLVPALAKQHCVHAVDLPGHGRSLPLPDLSVDRVVDVLDAALGDMAAPADILGWSLGGTLALAWARKYPRHARRLVLVAATPKFAAGDGWPHAMPPSTLARFADELRVAYRPTLQRFVTLQVQGSEEGRATLAKLRHALFEHGEPDAALLSGALAMLGGTDLRAEVPAIAQRTLVIAGDRDTLVPAAAAQWLAATLPDARLRVIEGAAHAPFLSHPRVFTDAVLAFLSEAA